MFKELFTEAKKVQIIIDWASEDRDLAKDLSKQYKIKIVDDGRMSADVSGDPKKIKKFLLSADYGLDYSEIEEFFPELISEAKDGMSKDLKKKLEKQETITTNKRTATAWYSPNTQYEIDLVDDGFYSKKPGVHVFAGNDSKFIPLKDINTSLNESKSKYTYEGTIKDAKKVEKLLDGFDFYSHMIDDYQKQLRVEAKNKEIKLQLSKLGVSTFQLIGDKTKRTV